MKKIISLVLVLALSMAAEIAKAEFTFGTPTNLGLNINSPYDEWDPSISMDGLVLFFSSWRPEGYGESDLWMSKLKSISDDWGEAVNLGPIVNSTYIEGGPSISSDGLELYFDSSRPGGSGSLDLWVARRATKDEDWAPPVNLGQVVNSSAEDQNPCISTDGLELFFESRRVGSVNYDLWITSRESLSAEWGPPVNLGPIVNSLYITRGPSISSDGLWLFLGALRDEQLGLWDFDIWVINRVSRNEPWSAPVNLGPTLNGVSGENNPDILTDGLKLFFASDRLGGLGDHDIWQAPIIPIVDFNGNGIVDSTEMSIMVDYWGTDELLCDIGPTPLGDGIVDVQDLIVLAKHLFEEVNDPTLVAHWPLDETQDVIAYDSAADCDGTLMGDPAWQPEGGMLYGALQLDGIDDNVSTPFVLNPADGKFSVFAWIKGGAPGQVVISQTDGVNWLYTDTLEGYLMTELKASGRGGAELLSQAVITDGNWHRIGFVWDGSNRTLYVDGLDVAEDTQDGLEGSEGGLYIGTSKSMESGTYWSGLIDDVRIYNRAVTP